jgi:hypothetical protein
MAVMRLRVDNMGADQGWRGFGVTLRLVADVTGK